MKKQLELFTLFISLLVSTGVGAQTIVLDGVPIGITNPKEGHFTNLEATTQITLGAETITNFSGLDDDKVKVSSGDTSDFLENQIVGGTGVTVNSDGSQITISAPPVNVEDSADGVEITFAGDSQSILDLNGTDLFIGGTDPTVTLGGQARTILSKGTIPNTTPALQQVIVDLPFPLFGGNHKLKLTNSQGFSEGLVSLSAIPVHDGSTWTEATSSAAWSGRSDHTSVVYDNKMWVIGGLDGVLKNDVWYSSNGITWTQATSSAAWSARESHTSLVFDNKMWVIGGYDGTNRLKDVWYSTDGISWTQATASAAWAGRFNHKSVVFDNKMWVFGGDIGSYTNDVWSSSDGITWTQATASANWSTRANHTSLVFDNKMWLMGGYGGSFNNDVWYSTNGITWTLATSSASWPTRTGHTPAVYDNRMWVIGGLNSSSATINDVWYSTDGINWTQATAAAAWATRYYHSSVVHDNKMWVLGGTGGSGKNNDVWHTSN
jgi:hypothetical protein